MNNLKYIILSLALLLGVCQCQASASDKKGAEPKITVTILNDSTANTIQCHHVGFSTEELQQEYQKCRNEYLADGGIMLHEEFATHHYAIKVKKNGKINYFGSAFMGNQSMEVTMEHTAEDDTLWRKCMRDNAAKIGMSPSDMDSDGM